MGLGDLIWDVERGRPLGMSRDEERWREERCSRLLSLWELDDVLEDDFEEDFDEDEEVLEDDLDDEEDEDLGTSRMLRARPVVGSTVDVTLGLWATWYPSMM
jgi:hypothetical protein